MSTRLCYDCEGSEILVRELLGGAHRPEVLSFHIDFISYLEIWQSGSSSVYGVLTVFLCQGHFRAEEIMEFGKVKCVFLCSGRAESDFRVDC